MDRKYLLLLIILVVGIILLSVNISYAKEWKEHDFKVQDKRIESSYSGAHYYINTLEFGDIELNRHDYYKCFINDTITVRYEMGSIWLDKINGESI